MLRWRSGPGLHLGTDCYFHKMVTIQSNHNGYFGGILASQPMACTVLMLEAG